MPTRPHTTSTSKKNLDAMPTLNINMTKTKPLAFLMILNICNKILMDRYSDTVFLRQFSKQHLQFKHAWNHISEHTNMVNDTS